MPMKKNMIDVTSGGILVDKTSVEVRNLIATMATNRQQFGARSDPPPRKVNEVGISTNIEQQLNTLIALGQHLAVEQVKPCGICSIVGHPTDMYLSDRLSRLQN